MDVGEEMFVVFYYFGYGVNFEGYNYILLVDIEGVLSYEIEDGGVLFEDIFN